MKKDRAKPKVQPAKSSTQQNQLNSFMITILFLIVGIIPLLLRVYILQAASPVLSESSIGTGDVGDLFSYVKMVWLIIGTIVLSGVFLYALFKKRIILMPSYINLPTGLMYLFFLLSGMFAEYKTISLLGQYSRHEGTLVYLCYIALFFIAANLRYVKKHLNWLFYPVYLFVSVNALLGLIWFYNTNILDMPLMKYLLIPEALRMTGGGLAPGSFLMNTISNPDFSSGIGAVMAIFLLTRAMFIQERDPKLVNLFFATLAFSMIPTSVARSGFYTFAVMLLLLLVIALLSAERKEALLTLLGGLCTFVVVFVLLSFHNPALWERSKTLGFLDQPTLVEMVADTKAMVNSVNPFIASSAYAETNSNTNDVFNLPPRRWAPGTGRLYIWKETVKLIPKHPLLGYGMDTLPFYFPQDDPQKNSGLNSPDTIVDKPHNFFLGIAYGAGLLTFAAFLILILRHLYMNLTILKLGINSERRAIIASLFAAWSAFLVQGFFNDSTLGTAPFFWVLFGVSVALLKEELEVLSVK